MPNWAYGNVTVTGTREGVKSFIGRFVSTDELYTIPGKRFFHRSFLYENRQVAIDEAMELFGDQPADAKEAYTFVIAFAWSAYSCLIDRYPGSFSPECISLADACIEDRVSVLIQTSEPGMCFEERITCDENGNVENHEMDLTSYRCKHCGEISMFGSFEDPEDNECPECGECAFERCEEV